MRVSSIVIAGVTSGVGKTTVAMAIMHGLRRRGFRVQPFKVGPDFIDPSYHTLVTGRQSRNLDVWMMGEQGVMDCFNNASQDADVAVIEGVMGLFDGLSGKNDFASTAHVAKILGAPVILVVDAGKGARSIAAIVLGFLHFDRRLKISGVILNNVAGEKHAGYVTDALAKVKVPVVGIISRNNGIRMQERHLGLIPAPEMEDERKKAVLNASKHVSEQLDLDKISNQVNLRKTKGVVNRKNRFPRRMVRIAIAMDESFNFYYPDNLDALRNNGAELAFFSPVHDRKLPENIAGIMLGGGFPEVLADKLENNRSMIKSISKAAADGIPIYGECGGLMYLSQSIKGYKGDEKARRMVGLVEADTIMTNKLTLNYTEADCNGPIFGRLSKVRGHEFHFSAIENISSDCRFAYSMKKGKGITAGKDGIIVNDNGLAAYMHLHFADSRLPARFVENCIRYSRT